MYYSFDSWNAELYHHGIKGQKWGERRFQNSDGSLTAAGKARYYDSHGNLTASGKKEYLKQYKKYKKLSDKADLKLQSANYSKYSGRMKKGAGVAAVLGAATVANSTVGKNVSKNLFNKNIKDFKKWFDGEHNYRIKEIEKSYQNGLAWNAANAKDAAQKQLWDRQDNVTRWNQYEKAWKAQDNATKANYDWSEKHYLDSNRNLTKVLGAATAAAAGYTAYNAVRASVYKHRMSDVGHSKAVAKAKAQAEKMQKMFGDVKMSDLTKKKK